MNLSLNKSDTIGIISSSLCLLHCLATPLLFAAQTQIINFGEHKVSYWSNIDIIFIFISAFAIYKTTNTTAKKWVTIVLWINWLILLFIIINEKLEWLSIPEAAIYFPSLGLICLHFYNSKYCQCNTEGYCVNKLVQ